MNRNDFFRPGSFFLLRGSSIPLSSDIYDRESKLYQDRADFIEAAVRVASPGISETLDHGDSTNKAIRAVDRYIARTQTRATPFGLFAGVALGEVTEDVPRAINKQRPLFALDSRETLAQVHIARDEQNLRDTHRREVIKSLKDGIDDVFLFANPIVDIGTSTGVRIQKIGETTGEAEDTTVVYTPALMQTLAHCAQDVRTANQLSEFLASEFDATIVDAKSFISLLVTTGILIAVQAERDDREVCGESQVVIPNRDSSTITESGTTSYMHKVSRAVEKIRTRSTSKQRDSVIVDSTLNVRSATLNRSVAQKVATGVTFLTKIAAISPGHLENLNQFRSEFEDFYGAGELVSIKEVLNEGAGGIGPPDSYLHPQRSRPFPDKTRNTESDRIGAAFGELIGTVQDNEIEVLPEWIDRWLETRSDFEKKLDLYPCLDAYFQVTDDGTPIFHEEAIAYGGRTYGRFAHMFRSELPRRIQELAQLEESLLDDEAIHCELSYAPLAHRAINVLKNPGSRKYAISLDPLQPVHKDQIPIQIDDLYVGSTGERLFLWSDIHQRRIFAHQGHMINAALAPNLARFMLDVSKDGYLEPSGFRWPTSLGRMAVLPRVVAGGCILRPRGWTVPSQILEYGDKMTRVRSMADWAEKNGIDENVDIVTSDSRVKIDLTNPDICVDTIDTMLKRHSHGPVVAEERFESRISQVLVDGDKNSYMHELVLPVTLKETRARMPPIKGRTLAVGRGNYERSRAQKLVRPGQGEWISFNLYCTKDGLTSLFLKLEPALIQLKEERSISQWFIIRYVDQNNFHIRLRMKSMTLGEDSIATALRIFRELDVFDSIFDISITSYSPEVTRYGGSSVFPAVEKLFCSSSETSLNLLKSHPSDFDVNWSKADHEMVLCISLLHKMFSAMDYEFTRDSEIYSIQPTPRIRQFLKTHREILTEALEPWDRSENNAGTKISKMIDGTIILLRDDAVAVAGNISAEKNLTADVSDIYGSLAHMQVNRLMGIDTTRESEAYALWMLLYRGLLGRPQ